MSIAKTIELTLLAPILSGGRGEDRMGLYLMKIYPTFTLANEVFMLGFVLTLMSA